MTDEEREVVLRKTLQDLVRESQRRGGAAVINAILDHPEATSLIESLGAEELHGLMLGLGREDCCDLIRFATEEQFQGLCDLDCWKGREFKPERMETLVGLTVAAGEEAVDNFFASLDEEMVALYLLKRAQLIERTGEPDQEDQFTDDQEVWTTPDGQFYLVMPAGDPLIPRVRYFLEMVYARDHLDTTDLLQRATREDLDLLEEEASEARTARIRTLGFPTTAEVEALFKYVVPAKEKEKILEKLAKLAPVDPGYESLLPVLMRIDRRATPFLNRVVERMADSTEKERAAQGLAYLANAVLVRESGGDLTDEKERETGLRRAVSLVSLGLEFLADGQESVGAQILARVPARRLFMVGHSSLLPLRQKAEKLVARAGKEHGFFFYDPPLDDVVRGAFRHLPQLFEGLTDPSKMGFTDFSRLEELKKVRRALEQAEGVADYVEKTLRLEAASLAAQVPAELRPLVSHTTLMATALVNAMLNRSPWLQPIPIAEIPAVTDLLLVPAADGERSLHPGMRGAIERFVSAEENRFAAVLFDLALRKLEDLFRKLPRSTPPDPRYVGATLLVK
jgi:hypothetical protein